jgi:hypothetical protein
MNTKNSLPESSEKGHLTAFGYNAVTQTGRETPMQQIMIVRKETWRIQEDDISDSLIKVYICQGVQGTPSQLESVDGRGNNCTKDSSLFDKATSDFNFFLFGLIMLALWVICLRSGNYSVILLVLYAYAGSAQDTLKTYNWPTQAPITSLGRYIHGNYELLNQGGTVFFLDGKDYILIDSLGWSTSIDSVSLTEALEFICIYNNFGSDCEIEYSPPQLSFPFGSGYIPENATSANWLVIAGTINIYERSEEDGLYIYVNDVMICESSEVLSKRMMFGSLPSHNCKRKQKP